MDKKIRSSIVVLNFHRVSVCYIEPAYNQSAGTTGSHPLTPEGDTDALTQCDAAPLGTSERQGSRSWSFFDHQSQGVRLQGVKLPVRAYGRLYVDSFHVNAVISAVQIMIIE